MTTSRSRSRSEGVRVFLSGILLAGCGVANDSSGTGTDPGVGESTNTDQVDCSRKYSAFNSSPKVNATSTSSWSCTSTTRLMTGNGIPDHAVTGGNFATPISAQNLSVSFPLVPVVVSAAGTALVHKAVGYALNSVKFDPETDGSCSSTATSTAPGGGCVAIMGRDPWKLEAIGGAFMFGTDENNAHVQPNGQYHYHGVPEGMIASAGQSMKLVGFAMDGFPVYARYGHSTATDASSAVKVMTPSYRKKSSPDAGRPSTSIFPMGTFTQDYEYASGSGDLDECNGRTGVTPEFPNGTYHYYITDTYPYIQRCVKGTPL